MDKATLRRQLRKRLHALNANEILQKSSTICENLITSTDWEAIKTISCYRSLPLLKEVDTLQIIAHIQNQWPKIDLDIVSPDQQSALPSKQYQLIIVPVLGFDASNNRLGRGGGWYDRFLSTQEAAQTIGLAFDCQAVDSVPIEYFDVELDDIITESQYL